MQDGLPPDSALKLEVIPPAQSAWSFRTRGELKATISGIATEGGEANLRTAPSRSPPSPRQTVRFQTSTAVDEKYAGNRILTVEPTAGTLPSCPRRRPPCSPPQIIAP